MPDLPVWSYWLKAVVAMFFSSIILYEVGHSLVALERSECARRGVHHGAGLPPGWRPRASGGPGRLVVLDWDRLIGLITANGIVHLTRIRSSLGA